MSKKVLKKYASHIEETYARTRSKPLSKVGYVGELAVKGAEKFWPKEKLVQLPNGKQAPRPMSEAECREFRHRCREETGVSFIEANGTESRV